MILCNIIGMLALVLGYTIAMETPDSSEYEKRQLVRYEMALAEYERAEHTGYLLGGLALGGGLVAGVALSAKYGIERGWPLLAAAGVSGVVGIGAGAIFGAKRRKLEACGVRCGVGFVLSPRFVGITGRF